MDLDDLPIGRVLTRREALAVLGSTGAVVFLGGSTSTAGVSRSGRPRSPCVVRPASTAGPYYVHEKLNRADIRSDPSDDSVRQGALLALTLHVSSMAHGTCSPLEDAIVDVWQCNAEGARAQPRIRWVWAGRGMPPRLVRMRSTRGPPYQCGDKGRK